MTKITKTVNEFDTIWYKNEKGQYHNENAPAVIWANGAKWWCKNGRFHNEDGPAIVSAPGESQWWLDGVWYSEQDWKDEMFKRCFQL